MGYKFLLSPTELKSSGESPPPVSSKGEQLVMIGEVLLKNFSQVVLEFLEVSKFGNHADVDIQ